MKKSCILLITLILPFSQILFAQDKPVNFDRLSTRDGLSQNRVFDIVQDNHGFIWIATEDGLNRYDGYNFKVYKNDPNDSTSMNNGFIETLFLSKSGDLWMGGRFGGLSRYNYNNETFSHLKNNHIDPKTIASNNVFDISEDTKGNLWIATSDKGFDYFDSSNKVFYHMENLLPQGYQFNTTFLSFIHQDNEGRLWVGGIGKLHLFRVEYHQNGIPKLIPIKINNDFFRTGATTIEEDINGTIWIGTANEGLFYFDQPEKTLEPYPLKIGSLTTNEILISAIESDKNGTLWLGGFNLENGVDVSFGNGFGVIKINPEKKTLQQYRRDPENENSLSGNDILKLYKDKTDVLWVGTDLNGINKYDDTVTKFHVFKPSDFIQSKSRIDAARGFYLKNDIVYIASAAGGVITYDRKKGKYDQFLSDPNNPHSVSSNFSKCIYDDGKYLWIGTNSGLNRFDLSTKSFKRFYLDPSQIDVDLSNTFINVNSVNYNIIEIEKMPGYLWYGSNGGGLVRFNKNDYTFKNYTYDPEIENSFNNNDNFVRVIWYSKSFPNEIWTGSTHGINILNLETEEFRYFTHDQKNPNSLSHDNIMHFYEDEKGYIWISTYGGGLNRFDPKTGKFLRFTESNSDIPNNSVYGVLPDEQGNLWMSTNNGISKFNPSTFQFRNYSLDDGLQGEEFNGGALYKSDEGEMFFGGIDGFNSFFPSQVVDNNSKPEIVITDLKIFNESVKPDQENSPLKKQISNTKEVILSYWQNDISFEYVGLHYANASRNKYAFKLENYEDEWRNVDNIRIATYTNLDHGEYVFHVKGSNSDGLWNEAGTSLKLTILPPWWRTYWAYLCYIIMLILAAIGIDRIQRARVKAQEKHKTELALLEAENKRKSLELEEARSLQLSMLPKELPQLPNLDIAVYMQTATEVGGDYYDFHVALDGTLTVVIGDATGHGMKAGTMVTAAKSLFNSYAPNPDILYSFSEITRCIKKLNMGKMSMCLTMLKIKGDKMEISTAGMPPSFIFRGDTKIVEEHMFQGMPLGTMEKFPYELKDTTLKPGDTILLMSDGLPELANEKEEMYGYKKIRNGFEDVADKAPEEIITYLKNEGSDWVNHEAPDDDVTFVVIKVK
ncbi:MAG: hypothetical protein D8M58_10335 [Calditrichaeota bacterium]|nr:MAG: hypothetical protein DWQ03_09710 [Calditrichota bacterium]MBL1205787.1 hypothetical protein [Calditrichota bacterium]NOG45615.1 SpoIIE family protein phosphatase [Calditrichota bacterium]